MAHQIIGPDFVNPHKVLQGNITVLLNFHPASDKFKSEYKENMFMLPNKRGFYEVTNYINNIIDKEKWHSMIDWPVINNKDEMKFRRGLIKFTTNLNTLYDAPVIPTLNPSVMMSPGGIHVARFVLKLSEYAMRKFMEESFGFENTLQCITSNAATNGRLKLETVQLHENVQCLKELEQKQKNYDNARKKMQQQLLEMRASNDAIEQEICRVAPDNYSKEHIEQWTCELNKRVEERQNNVDYLASIEKSVNRYQQVAVRVLEKDASNLILDGSKIIKSSTETVQTSTDLISYFQSSAAFARGLTLKLKSSESTLNVTQLTTAAQEICTKTSLELIRLEDFEKELLNSVMESKRAINDLEPIAYSSIIDEDKIPLAIRNYAPSPEFRLVKIDRDARRLPIIRPRSDGNHILDWIKKNVFKETEEVRMRSNINTPVKREHVSLLPKRALVLKNSIGFGVESEPSTSRVQHNEAPETPKRNSFGAVRRLIQEAKAETPKPQSLEDSIVLPHNLSVSTASPCNNSTCVTPDNPKDLCWQPAGPSTVSSDDRLSNAVSSITSPNTWAHENEDNFASSTRILLNNYSTCSSPAEHQSQNVCHSSPSGVVHLPENRYTSSGQKKVRPSIENLIARYKALKRSKLETSDA